MKPPTTEQNEQTPTSVGDDGDSVHSSVLSDDQFWHGRRKSIDLVKDHAVHAAQMASVGQGLVFGVIFPCMSNILGVILFLRAPWIVGKAGIANGFCLVFVCCLCTFVTSLSLSAVSTNGKIRGGGSYYLISRSLGPALGAGVGLCFYMANSIGAAMYLMGTVEAWEIAQPQMQILTVGDINNVRVTALCMLIVCLAIVGGGIRYVARLSAFFLGVVLLTILFMYIGCFVGPDQFGTSASVYTVDLIAEAGSSNTTKKQLEWSGLASVSQYFAENWGPAWEEPQRAYPSDTTVYSFVNMMALWFPANTGIMAGSNRSADLKDPSGDIPRGTLFAQLFTSFIYLSFIVIYGCVAPRETLLNDRFFASTAAWPLKEVVIYGVMASTIGAGLTSLTSGTRLLSAIAADNTLPILSPFAAKSGQEPRLALIASGLLCACAIAIGELNAVAPILTMFFLMCYTCVNASCTILELVQDPNWRPAWRFYHWSVSLFGVFQCIAMMFLMDAVIAMVAVVFCSCIMIYSAYNSHAVKWGDGFQGMKFQLARNILMKLDMKAHTKNWRPQVLVVTEAFLKSDATSQDQTLAVRDPELLKFVSQLKGGRGITIVGAVCSATGKEAVRERGFFLRQNEMQSLLDGCGAMKQLLKDYKIEGFGHVMYTEHFLDGLQSLVQVAGLGSFQPNCVMAAWPRDDLWRDNGSKGLQTRSRVLRTVQMTVAFNKAMMLVKGDTWPDPNEHLNGTIDVWWIVGDGGILLLLPFLLKKHKVWSGCKTRLFLIADHGQDPVSMEADLKHYVKDFRLKLEVKVKIANYLQETSPTSDLYEKSEGPLADTETQQSTTSSGDSAVISVDDIRGDASKVSIVKPADEPKRYKSGKIEDADDGALERHVSSYSVLSGAGVFPEASNFTATETLKRQLAGQDQSRCKQFVNSSDQLNSVTPCTPKLMQIAASMRVMMAEESKDAEVVVTNLPDMPPEQSALAYFQFLDEITKPLKRCIFVRGTPNEVITEFT